MRARQPEASNVIDGDHVEDIPLRRRAQAARAFPVGVVACDRRKMPSALETRLRTRHFTTSEDVFRAANAGVGRSPPSELTSLSLEIPR